MYRVAARSGFFPPTAPQQSQGNYKNNDKTMKKLFLFCLVAIMSMGAANAQTKKEANPAPQSAVNEEQHGAKIVFTEREHNYGTLQKGGDGNCEFTFTNTGDEPLILSSVRASCGCTTPSWTQKPIMPGKTGTIKVRYNTNNLGGFTKTITITSNAVNEARVVVKIKGNVVDPNQK